MKKLILVLAIALSGCATTSKLTADQQKKATEPILCENKLQCDIYWQRTQAWVAGNSHWRIQVATDTLLQTFSGEDSYPSFTVTKALNSNGGANIMMNVACGNMFGCLPSPMESLLAFKLSVEAK